MTLVALPARPTYLFVVRQVAGRAGRGRRRRHDSGPQPALVPLHLVLGQPARVPEQAVGARAAPTRGRPQCRQLGLVVGAHAHRLPPDGLLGGVVGGRRAARPLGRRRAVRVRRQFALAQQLAGDQRLVQRQVLP